MSEPDSRDRATDVPANGLSSWEGLRRANLTNLAMRIHDYGPLSRAELIADSRLSRLTVLDIVNELQLRGLVEEANPSVTGERGRPLRKLQLSGSRLAVIAVELRPNLVRVCGATLSGEVVVDESAAIDVAGIGPDVLITDTARMMRNAVRRLADRGLELVHVTIGSAGIVNREEGVIRAAKYLGWRDEPLLEPLARETGVSRNIFSLNRLSNLAIKAESLVPEDDDDGGTVMLYSDIGVGVAGAVRHGIRTIEGAFDPGGQFAHIIVERGGRPCFCGRRGCLEQYAGAVPLAQSLGIDTTAAPDNALSALLAGRDPDAVRACGEQAAWIARAIDLFAVTLGARTFILGGLLAQVHEIIGAEIALELQEIRPLQGGSVPDVRAALWARDGVVRGGILEGVRAVASDPSSLPILSKAPSASASAANS